MPTQDSGGPQGYRRLVAILGDPTHPEHQDAAHWTQTVIGDFSPLFDAAEFGPAAANRKLRLLSIQWWPQPVTDDERDAVIRPVRWLLDSLTPGKRSLEDPGHLWDYMGDTVARPPHSGRLGQ